MRPSILFCIGLVVLIAIYAIFGVIANFEYERDYQSAWELADKSSTLAAKQKWMRHFVTSLEAASSHFSSHDAMFLKTPDNSFELNLAAVKSLDARLTDISKMDPTSFQYNTAIEQITKQEQGEAHKMIASIKGCWFLHNHFFYWDWMLIVMSIFFSLACIGGFVWVMSDLTGY